MSRFARIFINSTWPGLQLECQAVEMVPLCPDNLVKAISLGAR